MVEVEPDDDAEYQAIVSELRAMPLPDSLDSGNVPLLRYCVERDEGMFDECFEGSIDHARHLIRAHDLATLGTWDAQAITDAALLHEGGEEVRLGWGGEAPAALQRRVALALLAESAPAHLRPVDAALLLKRAGIGLDYYLREALVAAACRSDAFSDYTVRQLRELQDIRMPAAAPDQRRDAPLLRPGAEARLTVQLDQAGATKSELAETDRSRVTPTAPNRVNNSKRRQHRLAPVIKLAESQAVDPRSWMSIWDALVSLAESAKRPAPLLGYVAGEGIQCSTSDESKPYELFTRNALRQYIERQNKNPH